MIFDKKKDTTLFTKFKRKITPYFLDPNTKSNYAIKEGEKLDIILSPALYWVKKVELPVKYLRDVKKLLPSLFEDILPEGNFSYTAYKEGDTYFIFAYEDKKILELLQDRNIALSDIASICFAQGSLALDDDKAYGVNEEQALYMQDGIMILTPKVWFEKVEPLEIKKLHSNGLKIALQQYGHIVDNKSIYIIGVLLVMLIVVVGVEIFITKAKAEKMEAMRSELFSKYKLHPTMMQNRAILSSYKAIYEKQTKLRTVLAFFLKMPLKKTEKITLVEYSNNRLHVRISNVVKAEEKHLFKAFHIQNIEYKTTYTSSGVEVEVMI